MENNPAEVKKRSSHRTLIIAVTAVILVLAAVAAGRLWYNASNPAAAVKEEVVNIRVTPAAIGSLETSSIYTGKLTAVNEVNVIPKIPGKVLSVEVALGDRVSAGDVLFRIDAEDVQRQVNQARIQYDAAKRALDGADSAVKSAERMVETAKVPASPPPGLPEGATGAGIADPAAEMAKAQAEAAARAQAESALMQAKAGYEQANVQFQLAQEGLNAVSAALSDCAVTAPIDGYVTALNVQKGGMASQAMPSAVIADTNALRITTSVSAARIDDIRIGDAAQVYVRALSDEPFAASIVAVVPAPPAGSAGYPVVIGLANGDSRLKPGMFAEIRMVTGKATDVVVIPSDAVLIKGGEEIVMVIGSKGGAQPTRVETGLDDGSLVEIKRGLKADDKVVCEGQFYLNEDSKFKIVE
ncbi:MAG: efflux RND transporter periplasmic adaptor subunit [Clostridiales Family XIII bacterium]|jgi:RND family efflux transporter MFP subunit|nr:efflux RND transporter periplasmic adaptor subunit [Clostridiales Family XIII bacterium]